MPTATVTTSGNSMVIVLPKKFRERNNIRPGDKVKVDFPTEHTMTVSTLTDEDRKERLRIAQEFNEYVDSLTPVMPVPQTREEERALLAERYV